MVTTGREVYPEFRQTLEMLGGEDLLPAISALERLSKSDDPYLAAAATFYLAQACALAERYEDALPLLTDLLEKRADKTVLTGDATFLLGTCQARMLARKEAVESFTRYLDQNPSAPERMRIAAWRQCEALKQLEEGTMADVYDRMDFSRRHLNLEKSGTDTQEQQETIVAMLTKLIKEAEDRECQCSGGGGQQPNDGSNSQGQGQGKGQQGGNSRNQNGKVVRQYNNGPQSPWSKLRNKERDPAYSAIKEKFPARYQQLIEQYYKSFE